jgi:hypothetical protein
MQGLIAVPIATTPRMLVAVPYLFLSFAAALTIIVTKFSTDSQTDTVLAVEMAVKAAAAAVLLAGWEYDRRSHFEACVRTFRQSRHISLLVDRLRRHIDGTLPAGCALPAQRSRHNADLCYASRSAAIVAVQLVLSPPQRQKNQVNGQTYGDNEEAECLRQLGLMNCLAEACDKSAVHLGAARYACTGTEMLVAVGLFGHEDLDSLCTSPASNAHLPSLRACTFAAMLVRVFRADYRCQFPDGEEDPPALRIGIDTSCVEAVVPCGSCRSLSVLVTGRAVRGAETLAGLAMPGSALVSGDVRALIAGHFYTTELHRLRVAGRTTAVSILGQQFMAVPPEYDTPLVPVRSMCVNTAPDRAAPSGSPAQAPPASTSLWPALPISTPN